MSNQTKPSQNQPNQFNIIALEPEHFEQVISFGNRVHGDNYLSIESLSHIHKISFRDGINASFVAFDGDKMVGFRLTYAPGQWPIDEWCTPQQWGCDPKSVCYFKCNTVDEAYRGQGLGSLLLSRSIEMVKKQGGSAGLAHIWLQSPGNSALRYMTRAGADIIKKHPDRWLSSSVDEGYDCVVCPDDCHCDAAEMILRFV